MESVNLKQLKEALNEMPNEALQDMYVKHGMWLEEYDTKVEVLWVGYERETYDAVYNHEQFKVLEQFVNNIVYDVKKGLAVEMGLMEEDAYIDDTPEY